MTITLKLIDSLATVGQRSSRAIAEHVNSLIIKRQRYILGRVRQLAGVWIREQPEIISLLNNELAAELGLIQGTAHSTVEAIISSVQNSTDILIDKFSRDLSGSVSVRFQPNHFANLFALSQGHVSLPESGDMHWLKWLLEKGHAIIVVNYHFTPGSGKGRSRGGVMSTGGAWRVPPAFAGTLDNNFITRAFSGREGDIGDIFNRVLSG